MIRVFLPVLLLFVLIGIVRHDSNNNVPPVVLEERDPLLDSLYIFLEDFDQQLIQGANQKNLPGGSYVITYKDEILVAKGFGNRRMNSPLPIDEHTVFRLGSVSKGFASVLTGILVDNGYISFDDPVSEILPRFQLSDADQTNRVTITHLLSHTSGLPRHAYTNLIEDGLSLERILPRFESVGLIGREGTQQAYTNAAFSMVELALEERTDSSFNSLLNSYLFSPLGLENTTSTYESIIEDTNVALPHLYSYSRRQRVPVEIKDNYYNAVSAGGINTSAYDMGKWLLLLTGNYPELIKNETLDQIFEPISVIPNKRFSRHWDNVDESYYGMGWRTLNNNDQKIVYHGGYVNGYRSEVAFDKENKIGICILLNSNSSYALEVIPDFFQSFNEIDDLFKSRDTMNLGTSSNE